jgi:hypothetical protein
MLKLASNRLAHRASLVPTGKKSLVRRAIASSSRSSAAAENRANDVVIRFCLARRSGLFRGVLFASRSTARSASSYAFSPLLLLMQAVLHTAQHRRRNAAIQNIDGSRNLRFHP